MFNYIVQYFASMEINQSSTQQQGKASNRRKVKTLLLGAVACLFLMTGCYKVHRTFIVKGKWYLNAFEIDGGSTNHMEGFLPDYTTGDGTYVIYMW